MKTYKYKLSFFTPAFLGNASQQAQWRTPPLKALLRQWWRVAVAPQVRYNPDTLRQREAELFGVAADGGDSHQSLVRLRLEHWNEGKLKDWPRHGTVTHPEVPAPVGSDLYMGFGPLEYDRANRTTAIRAKAAIQAGDSATFKLAFAPRPGFQLKQASAQEHVRDLETALWLMQHYGTLGGRSRNGWGSFLLQPENGTPALNGSLDSRFVRPWQEALALDWPHALGHDSQGPLIWQTAAFDDWTELMRELAQIKIGLRTQFKFPTQRSDGQIHTRHWLSYPVTNHSVQAWGNNARLPNSLRFKVRSAPGNPKQVVGVIFHMPCQPPLVFQPRLHLQAITAVWQQVHRFLDSSTQQRTRIPA